MYLPVTKMSNAAKIAWDYINEEAKEQFYIWEKAEGRADLSADDRVLWCDAYIWSAVKFHIDLIKEDNEKE